MATIGPNLERFAGYIQFSMGRQYIHTHGMEIAPQGHFVHSHICIQKELRSYVIFWYIGMPVYVGRVLLRSKLVHRDWINVVNAMNVLNAVNASNVPHPPNSKSVYIAISSSQSILRNLIN